ncbi:SRPBCC family protein [Nocardioides sp.]|uniref:SRPBCC family protein n=1 Tax=Nocardioides sp. TaxID=35761 RepID=UPI002CC4F53B|nr:SRPBCC family protein [Nocardioides sp.]HXH80359.1 SRPBCC family protein [Nocardioides sp.]
MATVTLSQSRAVPVAVDEAFDRVLAHPLTEIFRRRRLAIPPIKDVRDQQGDWGTVGQTRVIVLADGGTMLETLTSNDRPHSFGYTISEIRGPMKPLVASADGLWTFEPAGTGTRITWAWELTPTTAGRVAMPAFATMWRGYARQALEEIEAILLR